ncbi:MAG: thiamine biosynthesis lipoprotein, partial [Colwellia sp.]
MNKIKLALLTALVLALSACFPSNNTGQEEILLQGRTMGTTYNIKVVGTNEQVEA